AGNHPNGSPLQFDSTARFDGLARMKSGEWRSIEASLTLSWEREASGDGPPGEWRIRAWTTESLRWNTTPRRLFSEVLETSTGPAGAAALRRSQHYEATVKYYREGMKALPHPYFAPISVNQKEGIAVADVNRDGLDDIYITVRLGKNMLLINRGDGTFTEEAAAYHLDLPGHTTCALFADFDNDGDLDAMLGRSLLKSTYLENRDGVYFQHPIPKFMPMAVISMAAADYNGDGLLDVYLCTYRPAPPAGSGAGGGFAGVAKEGDFDWPDEFFSPEVARDFRRRLAEHKQKTGVTVLDQLGPPNLLLVNRGEGRFEPAPETATVGLWRNSLQATWGDFNQDGRPDLYIPNDWGLNVLFRNDGPDGFTDVTRESGLTYYGFSMGASWGDYDNDGRDDLYVSNMHSEAGRRIVGRIEGLDRTFPESAAGNYLYHSRADGSFAQVAGREAPAVKVMNAGWSWGGCFADFDNDTFLDLYVLNGYFTAPEELASGLDLESNLWRTMVRADANLSRPSFRFSPEWRRTPAPDHLGPEIDARLAGVERRGDSVLVHSLHGGERNRYFANRGGKTFLDASGISGLDTPADSRGFAILDFDRDGWQDVALVNANQPLFNLYRNEMPSAGITGGMIALRFVGGSRTPHPGTKYAARDGYGARVQVDLGVVAVSREHRCGEGWSVQNSATMIVGIGSHATAKSVTVRWPSGQTSRIESVPEGTLLTAYENPEDSANGQSFSTEPYRIRTESLSGAAGSSTFASRAKSAETTPSVGTDPRPVFFVHTLDTAAKPARLRVYTVFATSNPASTTGLPALRRLHETLRPEGVDFVFIPVDPADDNPKLAAFAREQKPSSRLVNLPASQRGDAARAFAQVLGRPPTPLATVLTDGSGRILAGRTDLPSISELRALMAATAP
ncbi:MAG: FG-GAP-like repeat-containing protein, partial [Limisphaerales bacterium]